MKNINVFFVGTAGSGKSALTSAFMSWMNQKGLDAVTINLDPGVEFLSYEPNIDIREWVSLSEIMRKHNLGPNGAQIACADLLVFNIERVKTILDEYKTNYILIDTPGQIELFTFRHSSTKIVDTFGPTNSVLIFLVDPFIVQTPTGFVSELLLASTVQLRFGIPLYMVVSKTDMIEQDVLDKIISWSEDLLILEEGLMKESDKIQSNFNFELLRILQDMDIYRALAPTSAETGSGMEDIYNFIQQIFEGGEDLMPD
jgi:GTPase SAR1 family protein